MIYREAGQFKTSYAADQAIFPIRQDRLFVLAAIVAAFLVVPLFASEYLLRRDPDPVPDPVAGRDRAQPPGRLLRPGLARQRRLHGGGRLCLLQSLAAASRSLNLIVVFLFGGLMAAAVGILFGLPSLRIKGFYLAVATLAAQFFLDWLFIRVTWFTNYTPSGSVARAARPRSSAGRSTAPAERYLLHAWASSWSARWSPRTWCAAVSGRSWMAIRDMDIAAEIIGIRPLRAKLSAFAVSSFFIGIAGALWAFVHLGAWEPLAFDIDRSFQLLFMVIIGGLGSILGCFLGAAFIMLLPILLNQLPAVLGVPMSTAMICASRVHDLRRADRVLPDRRAARPGPALGDRQGEAAAVAVPALIS